MDVREQQLVVRQHMNDRLAEARMARLAREARLAGDPFEVQDAPIVHHARGYAHGPLSGFLAGVAEAAAAIGQSIAPRPPVQVRVARR